MCVLGGGSKKKEIDFHTNAFTLILVNQNKFKKITHQWLRKTN